jgi:HSP20 family molecular chaperone IbpA
MAESDPRTWMWNEALAMIARAEHLHRRFFEPGFAAIETTCWEPPIDIFETRDELWLVAALPGVEAADLRVSLEGDTLRLAGQRRLPLAARAATIHRLEIPHGHFERRIQLPARHLTLQGSELLSGCLVIRLAKAD